ncbi:hypothetical protein BB558_001761 [Smittium angustum]|uniref:Telomere length regulation protein conserved domain-containing protein n=1 Tax=Smittium angustum TaxID=133377 RepID=A0A2U1JAX7_SMIAN|nr:hypothetical protein BB558_001761 [Smittium angustum]
MNNETTLENIQKLQILLVDILNFIKNQLVPNPTSEPETSNNYNDVKNNNQEPTASKDLMFDTDLKENFESLNILPNRLNKKQKNVISPLQENLLIKNMDSETTSNKNNNKAINDSMQNSIPEKENKHQILDLCIWVINAPLNRFILNEKPESFRIKSFNQLPVQLNNKEVEWWEQVSNTIDSVGLLSDKKLMESIERFTSFLFIQFLIENNNIIMEYFGTENANRIEEAVLGYFELSNIRDYKLMNLWKCVQIDTVFSVINLLEINNGHEHLNSDISRLVLTILERGVNTKAISLKSGINVLKFRLESAAESGIKRAEIVAFSEWNSYLRMLASLPDKLANNINHKLIPECFSRKVYFNGICSEISKCIELLIATNHKLLFQAIVDIHSKLCRIGYSGLIGKSMYSYANLFKTIGPENNQSDTNALFLIWVSIVNKLEISDNEKVKNRFFKSGVEELLDSYSKLVNFWSLEQNEDDKTRKINEFKSSIYFLGTLFKMWMQQLLDQDEFNRFVIDMISMSSVLYAEVSEKNDIQFGVLKLGNYLCPFILQALYIATLEFGKSCKWKEQFSLLSLAYGIVGVWGNKNFISKSRPEIQQNISAALVVCLSLLSIKDIKSIFYKSEFMSAVPMYFNSSDNCTRLAATVVAETVTKKYNKDTDSKNTNPEIPNDSEFDFGLDYVIQIGDSAIDSRNFLSKNIGESSLIKQMRLMSENSSELIMENKHNDSFYELLWMLDLYKNIYKHSNTQNNEELKLSQKNIFGNELLKNTEIEKHSNGSLESDDEDIIYSKRQDTFFDDQFEPNLPDFVKRRPPVYLRDSLNVLRSQSNTNWDVKLQIMHNLGKTIVITDYKELVNLSEALCRTIIKMVYNGPQSGGNLHEGLSTMDWDKYRQTSLVCLGLKQPRLVCPILSRSILSKDLSIIDKSIVLSSISAISLTIAGVLPLPEPFKLFLEDEKVERMFGYELGRIGGNVKGDLLTSTENTVEDFKKILKANNKPKQVEQNKKDNSRGEELKESKVTFRSRKLDIDQNQNSKSGYNKSLDQIISAAQLDFKSYPSFVGPAIFFPLANLVWPYTNDYGNSMNFDSYGFGDGYENLWEMGDLNMISKVFSTIGIVLHTSSNSPHLMKIVTEYLRLIISVKSVPKVLGLFNKYSGRDEEISLFVEKDETKEDVDKSGVLQMVDSVVFGLLGLLDPSRHTLTFPTLLTHFRTELTEIFSWLRGCGLLESSRSGHHGFDVFVGLGELLSDVKYLGYGSGAMNTNKHAFGSSKNQINL